MDLTRVVSSPESLGGIQKRQLALAGLSSEGLDKDEHLLVGYYHQDEMVGTVKPWKSMGIMVCCACVRCPSL